MPLGKLGVRLSLKDTYKNKKVLITGNTGFKGSWLSLILKSMGAEVLGYSIDVPTQPSHFELLNLEMESITGDVRNKNQILKVIKNFKPDIVFHLAAQSLVRPSYDNPIDTFETNVMGTVNVLEAIRQEEYVQAVVNITSDKCYENKEMNYSYKEEDPLGGYDPYSASKGCAEVVCSSYTRSFFNINDYKKTHNCLIASARAGNVIGGGDWADFRLLPDIFRSFFNKKVVTIKRLNALRPWQHVLEPLNGYLVLGEQLLKGNTQKVGPWNFGPHDESCISVGEILEKITKMYPEFKYDVQEDSVHEATLLKLDISKATSKLEWKPQLNIDKALLYTEKKKKKYFNENKIISEVQMKTFFNL